MKNIKLIIEYDGTNYCGFQKQKNGNTIQGEIEKGLRQICREPISIVSSGRTDSGVHAKGHAVSFRTNADLSPVNILGGLNACLPSDIVIKKAAFVPVSFHAQYDAKRKIYTYFVWNGTYPSPLRRLYSFHYSYRLDYNIMKRASRILCGRNDFRAFSAESKKKKNTVRTLYEIRIRKKGNEYTFRFDGDGFLYNMVRNIVGTLLYAGRGKFSVADIRSILKSKNRANAGPTVPAHGLILTKVIY